MIDVAKHAQEADALAVALQAQHADAETALERAQKAYGTAALQSELGQGKSLPAARAALQAAEQAVANITPALDEARRRSELLRRWSLTAAHFERRIEAATDLADALTLVVGAWKRLAAANEAAVRCAPQPLDAASLTGGALQSAIGLELTRLSLPFVPEKWPFLAKPIPSLVARVADANAHALRPASTALNAQSQE